MDCPIVAAIRPHGKARYELEFVDSNFVLSFHGRENFESQLNRALKNDKLLFCNKQKSQELFRVLGLQLSEGVNNLSFDTIIRQSRNIVNNFSEKKEEESIDHEPTFAEQVDMVLSGSASRFKDLKVCQTPEILLRVGCEQLPMLYAKSHLHEAIKTKNAHTHAHGLTVEQIKAMPDFLKSPVMVFDSLTRNDSIVVVTPEYDPDHNPVIISVRPNGHGKHDRDDTASNFVTGMYGKDNFVNFLNRTIEQKKLLYAHKEKSQELFRVLGLQSSKGVNNLSFDTIIHQSRNIVKSFSDNSQNAKIAVEEYGVDKETNKRLYNIREIETKTAKDIGFTNDSLRHSFLNGSTTSISELFKLVKTFDKGFYLNKRGNAEREELSAEETQSKTETAEYIDHINDDGQVSMFGNGEIAEANRAQKQKED